MFLEKVFTNSLPRHGGEQLEGRHPSLWLTNHVIEQILPTNIPPYLDWLLEHLDPLPGVHDIQEGALPRADISLHQDREGARGGTCSFLSNLLRVSSTVILHTKYIYTREINCPLCMYRESTKVRYMFQPHFLALNMICIE